MWIPKKTGPRGRPAGGVCVLLRDCLARALVSLLDRGAFDLSRPPPEGIFYNRMSASSHTRDHRYAAELTATVLAWLERHGRRVVNGRRAPHPVVYTAGQHLSP